MMKDMNSTKKTARIAGFLYLLLALTGAFSILYVPSTLIVFGDAAATAEKIASSELLFRAGILSGVVSHVIFVLLVWLLYQLLREISRKQAMLMVTLVVISVATGFVNTINQLGALIALSGADFLSAFEEPELDALAYLFMRLHSHGIQIIQIFWGLWLFPFGLLVYRSRFIPKILGVLVIIAGVGYLLGTITFLMLPQYQAALSTPIMILEMGELPIILWLLIVGVKAQAE
ncbi:MAG: DUF4386 domain-containing protein [Gammaproteobacteria bacterium]|nr:DUF4386 domain-containing protein [Gammaproteobacteria bacterium]